MRRLAVARPRRAWLLGTVAAGAVVAAISSGILLLPQAPSLTPPREVLPQGPAPTSLESLSFASPSVAWAVLPAEPYWQVVRSTDAGLQWLDVTPTANGTNGGLELTVLGAEEAAVAYRPYDYQRSSAFAYTKDGGRSWQASILPGAISQAPDPMALLPDGEVWAVLANGEVFRARGSSGVWTQVALPRPASGTCLPISVDFSGADLGWIPASCQGTVGLWVSSDGGGQWQFQGLSRMVTDPHQANLEALSVSNPGQAAFLAVSSRAGRQEVELLAWDGGRWSQQGALVVPRGRLLSSFAGSEYGWIVDLPSAKGAYALAYQTRDGGEDWSLRTLPLLESELGAVFVVGPDRAYLLVRTEAGGYLWESGGSAGSWHETSLHVFSGPAPTVNGVSS